MQYNHIKDFFPGISEALDLKKVASILKEAAIPVDRCEIWDVRYEPEQECILLYNVLQGEKNQLFLGKILKLNEIPDSFSKHAIYSSSFGIVLIPFPHDPFMSWVPQVSDSSFMIKKLSLILPQDHWSIHDIRITPLAYTPQMRVTFLYEIDATDHQAKKRKKLEWIVKTNAFKSPQRVYTNYWALWKAANEQILMPRPIGFLIDPALTFQEKIRGIRLGAIVNSPDFSEIMEKTALSLAQFHSLKIPLTHVRGLQQEIKNLNRWSRVLMHLRPDLKSRMDSLKNKIVGELENQFSIEAPIHADFHHTNILVEEKTVRFIDMDEVAYGDPCLDVGRFLSSLRIPSLRSFGSFDGLEHQREHFIETYLKRTSANRKKIHLFEAASLLTSAASTFRLQRRRWEEEVPMLLEESEKTFQESQKRPICTQFQAISEIEKSICLRWAEDEEYVRSLLSPYFHNTHQAVLTNSKLIGKKKKSNYDCLTFALILEGETGKSEEKIDIFIHQQKPVHWLYAHMVYLSKAMTQQGFPYFIPKPLCYLEELSGLVFFHIEENPLLKWMKTDKESSLGQELGKTLAAFHSINVLPKDCSPKGTSYLLRVLSLNAIHLSNGTPVYPFPIYKYVGLPDSDLERFAKKASSHLLFVNNLREAYHGTSQMTTRET